MSAADPSGTAQRLLDAQVAWLVTRFNSDELDGLVDEDLRLVLDATTAIKLDDLARVEETKQVARLLLAAVPASTAASTLNQILVEVLHAGPESPVTTKDLIDRKTVERILSELSGASVLVKQALDNLSTNPQVAALASGFVTKIVSDMVATNRAAAEKIPGVGSLVSLGATAAGKMIGAADKQLDAFIGDTAAKGATFAMRRLNRIIVDTLHDPATRAAILAVYDQYGGEPLPPLRSMASGKDLARIADLGQDMLIGAGATEPVLTLLDAIVDRVHATYAPHPVSALIADLGLSTDDLVTSLTPTVVRGIRAGVASGHVETLLRSRIAPFFSSPEALAILEES